MANEAGNFFEKKLFGGEFAVIIEHEGWTENTQIIGKILVFYVFLF